MADHSTRNCDFNHNHKHHKRKCPRPASQVQMLHAKLHATTKLISRISWAVLVLFVLSTARLTRALQSHSPTAFIQPQVNSYLQPGHNMDNLRINELEPVGSVVYTLKALDKSNPNKKITYFMTGDTFAVDENTGEVRLIKQLDRERQSSVNTVINIVDSQSEQPLESRWRTIVIEDADDSWPVFQRHKSSLLNEPQQGQYLFHVEVSERAPPGSIVMNDLIVTDADEGQHAEIVFECRQRHSSNKACEHFAIESRQLQTGRYSVTVRTKQALDYEQIQSFKLVLLARGRQPSPLIPMALPLEAEAAINIDVVNVQDEGPQFVNAPYSLSMPEGLEPGVRLLKLIVQDGDSAPQRDLSVIVAFGPFREHFNVVRESETSKVWHLVTNATLDREDPKLRSMGNMFTIQLLAAELNELGEPLASESDMEAALRDANYNRALLRRESVAVVLLDRPDSTPIFVRSSSGRALDGSQLVVNVSESLVDGSSVPNLDLTVFDLDQGANSRFQLKLVDGLVGPPASEAFALESEIVHGKSEVVLQVLNASLLDYEVVQRRVYRFQLVASKMAAPLDPSQPPVSLVQKLDVQLNIQDANDNWPEFDRDQYIVSVPEGSLPGRLVATIRARDRDSGPFGQVNHILRGAGSSKFKVITNEGKILVADCALAQCLDYEVSPSYSLTYEARDGGGHMRNVSVLIQVLDVNDHAPKFTEPVYKRELISDNLSSKQNYISPQLIVRAKDEDGPQHGRNNITYRIRSSNLTGLDVEPSSGLVYISQPLDLDKLIQEQQLDRPGGRGLSSGGTNYHHQRKIIFEAEVVADDNGVPALNASATILLVVKGNRDGAPQFKQDLYLAYVPENQPPGKPFYQVQAVDPDDKDSQLRYSLGYDPNDLVSIEAQSGQLAFKTRVDYDDFASSPYNVTVYATDNSRPYPLRASAIVSVLVQDVNNKAPKFAEREYRAVLMQGRTRTGDLVLRPAASDLDLNARLNYSLLTDELLVQDRNGQQFSLDDLANATGGYLAQMSRSERAKLVDHFRRLLTIDSRTGAIELKAEPDYSFAASVSVPVKVQDLNQEIFTQSGEIQEDQAECSVFLQTHVDKAPVFAPPWSHERRHYELSILEELPPETVIFSLLAKDPQTNQKVDTFEKVHESDPRNYFRVERTGQVLVNRRVDYEELPSGASSSSSSPSAPKRMSLSVKAISADATFASLAQLNIQIVDVNDNAPQFRNQSYSVSVSESLPGGQELLTVTADDRDSAEFSQVFYSLAGLSSDLFQIHPRKGVISLRKSARLDRDREPTHFLVATASDCNETSTAQLLLSSRLATGELATSAPADTMAAGGTSVAACKRTSVPIGVLVLDENDNEPLFLNVNGSGEFEAITSETVSVGAVIAQARAKDIDEGPNGQVAYEIVRTDERVTRLFMIDSEGYISAQASLSGLGRAQPYRLTIRAYDQSPKQSRQSYATLLLTISDVVENDGVPKFIRPQPDEVVTLAESAGPSTFVYQVEAVDPDEEANGKLMYKFLQPSDTFEIDPFEGVIKTRLNSAAPGGHLHLDRERVPNYTLIIVAQDLGSPPKQAHQVLTIRLSDINDNEPYFERELDDPPLVLQVEEEIPAGSLLGSIQAVDKDEGQNALIGYEIIDGNQNNLFRLAWEPELIAADGARNVSQPSGDKQDASLMERVGNNPCRIYSTGRLDRETQESYTLTIRASSMSKVRKQLLNLRDPLGGRNPFNQYNASDLSKIRVTIKLLDVNDNRPVFVQPNAKSVVDSSAEVYSQLMVVTAHDTDSSSSQLQYSILDAFYFSDSKSASKPTSWAESISSANNRNSQQQGSMYEKNAELASMKYVFDIHPRTGTLRNSVSLRPFTDGYFEVYVKADSGQHQHQQQQQQQQGDSFGSSMRRLQDSQSSQSTSDKCAGRADLVANNSITSTSSNLPPNLEVTENCFVAVTKAVVFVTHQRETFRFVFNKTKLNDRLEEFREQVQHALEELMFEPAQVQASMGDQKSYGHGSDSLNSLARAEKVYLNTFNTDFYERDDGSLDFSTITSCSQLVKFDDRSASNVAASSYSPMGRSQQVQYQDEATSLVPNQVVSYEDVVSLLKTLNATRAAGLSTTSGGGSSRQSPQQQQLEPSLFSQYGLVRIERCLPDKTMYKMTLSERLALYFAATIALVSVLLAFIVSKMRKNYEKNLKRLQRSKYQYMGTAYG